MVRRLLLFDKAAGDSAVVGFNASGAVNLDHTNHGWRTSWDVIVPGAFTAAGLPTLALYDRTAGEGDVVGFDAGGAQNLDHTNRGWGTTWDVLIAGDFVGNGRSQLVLFDRAGGAKLVGFDASGTMNLQHTTWDWDLGDPSDVIAAGDFTGRGQDELLITDSSGLHVVRFRASGAGYVYRLNPGWPYNPLDIVTTGNFTGSGWTQIARYNRDDGKVEVVGFDVDGKFAIDHSTTGLSQTSAAMAAGDFVGSGKSQLLLYDPGTAVVFPGEAAFIEFNATGGITLYRTNPDWRATWDVMMAGDFIGNGKSQLLLYDRFFFGEADVVGFDAGGVMTLDHTNRGWRKTWTNLVVL